MTLSSPQGLNPNWNFRLRGILTLILVSQQTPGDHSNRSKAHLLSLEIYSRKWILSELASIPLSFSQNTDPVVSFSSSQNFDAKVKIKSKAILLWQLFSANTTGLKHLLTNEKGNFWHFYRGKKVDKSYKLLLAYAFVFRQTEWEKTYKWFYFLKTPKMYFTCLPSNLTRYIKKNK